MSLAIRAGSLMDGTGQPARPNVVILVDQNRFTDILPSAEAAVLAGYDVLDASRYTLLPGLIDCQVHGGTHGSGETSRTAHPGARVFGGGR